MIRAQNKRFLACLGVALVISPAAPARAYNSGTHFRIASFAWQTMRMASDAELRNHVPFELRPTGTSFSFPDERRDCEIGEARCAGSTEDSYRAFLHELGASRRRLNELAPAVPDAGRITVTGKRSEPDHIKDEGPCHATPEAARVGAFQWKIGGAYHPAIMANGEYVASSSCSLQDAPWSGLYRAGTHSTRGLSLPDDGKAFQGRVFGYHAQQPDNLWGDTLFRTSPVFGPVLGVAAQVVDGFLGFLFIAAACAAALVVSFFGGDVDECVAEGLAAADSVSVERWLKKVLPGWDGEPSGDLVGVWHFIRPNDAGFFNDAPGLDYAHAGPGNNGPGALDQAIRLASGILWLRLNANTSDGEDHYFISTNEDGQEPSRPREDYYDQALVADLEFEPLDNLAQYGWARFRESAAAGKWSAEGLAFPLHALGDASVPQHAVGSTAYGHRPYEDWVDFNLSELLLESCRDDDAFSPRACSDSFLRLQIAQARRVLQWAHYFHSKTSSDEGVRKLTTLVAKETLSLVGDRPDAWPFCDACSTAYFLDDPDESLVQKAGVSLVELGLPSKSAATGRYHENREDIRRLVEMSVGATIALLVKASQGRCDDLGGGCAAGSECCTGSCEAGVCCRARGEQCGDSAECCAGQACNGDGVCCERASGATCGSDAECCTGRCNGGSCCKSGLGGKCEANADCCQGSCEGPATSGPSPGAGVCCTNHAGSRCEDDAECCTALGCGANGVCCTTSLGAACGAGDACCEGSCERGRCCIADGTACNDNADCCSSNCVERDGERICRGRAR
jgi:hypothetical protein